MSLLTVSQIGTGLADILPYVASLLLRLCLCPIICPSPLWGVCVAWTEQTVPVPCRTANAQRHQGLLPSAPVVTANPTCNDRQNDFQQKLSLSLSTCDNRGKCVIVSINCVVTHPDDHTWGVARAARLTIFTPTSINQLLLHNVSLY